MKQLSSFFMGILYIGMLGVGLVQLYAIASLFTNWFGGYFFIASIIGMFVSGIPILATVLGIYGAVTVLDWNIFIAFLLFAPMLILYIPMMLGTSIAVTFQKIKTWINS
ncbi:MAG TPA: hypothetical protein PLZ05_01525 [Alphaproteobacteria bacterium]|nr:hypothetical protein [Alphaproteobacteria bacterium]